MGWGKRLTEGDLARLGVRVADTASGAPDPSAPAVKAAATRRRNKKIEGALQKNILELLDTLRIYAQRLNSGATVAEYKGEKRFIRYGFPGCPDILIVGQPFPVAFIEVKKEDGEMSEDQEIFEDHCKKHEVPHLVARNMDDVIRWLRQYGFRI